MKRFSSRRQGLDRAFINQKLQGAVSYDRIAGFFRSSILEVAGEALEKLEGKIRVVCNLTAGHISLENRGSQVLQTIELMRENQIES